MVRHYIPKGRKDGQDRGGRFAPGHRLATGRPHGAGNKFPEPPKDLDPQAAITRRFQALLAGIIVDLGGQDTVSTGEMLIAQRCAWISALCEDLERRASPERPFDVTAYVALAGRLTQMLTVLGLKRVPKDVTPTPSLRDYLDAARQPDSDADSVDLSGQSPVVTSIDIAR
jgi:hypothetical protein